MEDISMNITKDYFEKQLKKSEKVTIYTQDNIPLTISKAPCVRRDDSHTEFEMDCADLADYCNLLGLSIKPNNH
jgi:hypothetical protein